jgi:hypothetical protein
MFSTLACTCSTLVYKIRNYEVGHPTLAQSVGSHIIAALNNVRKLIYFL